MPLTTVQSASLGLQAEVARGNLQPAPQAPPVGGGEAPALGPEFFTQADPTPAPALAFDIFCRVIDNYGDIGVCWRFARQLVQTGQTVRLWVDDLSRCHALAPQVQVDAAVQQAAGITLIHWRDGMPDLSPADVVIEAFACDPPASYVRRMTPAQVWINLEYLSAEPWVEGCHGLASPQPGGLRKWFHFPGFTPGTGGLLREPDLIARRDAWQADPEARWALLQSLQVPSCDIQWLRDGTGLQVFLFCYPHAPIRELLAGLAACGRPALVLAPPGTLPDDAADGLPDRLRLHPVPFVSQAAFDPLLWGSDLNGVRGEDSIVRAIWAGRPLLWHIYPQADGADSDKLEAWLARAPYPENAQTLIRAWNGNGASSLSRILGDCLRPAALSQWRAAARQWSHALQAQTDLVSGLLAFCAKHHRTG